MTNYEALTHLPIERFAELLIGTDQIDIGDEGMDGEYSPLIIGCFTSPASSDRYMDYEEALDETINWLKQDCKKAE